MISMITNITGVMGQCIILLWSLDFVLQTFKNIRHYYKSATEWNIVNILFYIIKYNFSKDFQSYTR